MCRRLDLRAIAVIRIASFGRTLMALTLLFLPWSLLVPPRLVLMALLVLLGLGAALLVSLLVKRRDEFLECSYQVNAEISLGFMGFFDRFGDILDGCRKAFE
jgi:hypothetical protein